MSTKYERTTTNTEKKRQVRERAQSESYPRGGTDECGGEEDYYPHTIEKI